MKMTIGQSQFNDEFEAIRPKNFSYEGLSILFDYFERYEEETGEEIELSVIAICCEYSEESWEDIAQTYDIDLSQYDDEEERIQAVIDHLQDNTQYLGITSDDSIIYLAF